ncbi:hypothetical protein LINPERPRIM_LOCUS25238, partial [Linum perenne]
MIYLNGIGICSVGTGCDNQLWMRVQGTPLIEQIKTSIIQRDQGHSTWSVKLWKKRRGG